ncbi:hypothetical protein HK099_003241 [Clydaea vesicula]|uniref:Uncharacterized protein n=1 Tax=Clydaea vesicula TaxID=447962 RepID=A0AAD5U579_9FUNG|nr:hypothetical protein HK099_003241 [Clydaea vesicula]
MLKTNSNSLKNNEMVIGETTFEKFITSPHNTLGIILIKAEEVDEAGFAVVHSSELCGKSQKRRLRFSLGFGEYKEGTFLENNLFVVFA